MALLTKESVNLTRILFKFDLFLITIISLDCKRRRCRCCCGADFYFVFSNLNALQCVFAIICRIEILHKNLNIIHKHIHITVVQCT